jgi:hypothetical protein
MIAARSESGVAADWWALTAIPDDKAPNASSKPNVFSFMNIVSHFCGQA